MSVPRPTPCVIWRRLPPVLRNVWQPRCRRRLLRQWQRQLASLVADVNTRIRYMGDWRISENGYLPFTLAQIEQRGFGDCKDMALTMAAMLRASGLQAQVALVRADVDNTPLLLSPQ